MPPFDDELDRIIELLRQTSGVDVAENYLRGLDDVAHSAQSWEMVRARFLAALEAKATTIDDLWEFQRDAEEHGHQHTFIFRGSDLKLTSEMIDPSRIEGLLRKSHLGLSLGQHRSVNNPGAPVITNVRVERSILGGNCLVIKVVETRVRRKALPWQLDGDVEVYRYQRLPYRSVNVARLHANNLLELRIWEHTANDEDRSGPVRTKTETYKEAIAKLRGIITPVLPYQEQYRTEVHLAKAKASLWANRKKLEKSIRFNYTKMASSKGFSARFATNLPQKGLNADPASTASIDEFMKHKGSYHDMMNLWWLKGDAANPGPSMEVHVRIGGSVNEFTVPTHCNGRDYNHVFGDIAKHNK